MPSLEVYDKKLDYSYCLGYYPAMLLLENRPESAFRLLLGESSLGEGAHTLREKCAYYGIREEFAPKLLKRISGKDNCYAALVFRKYEDTLRENCPHIVFNAISDSGNLGTAMRSAICFGFDDVALIKPCTDPFNPHTVRASMGALFMLRLKVYDSFQQYREEFPDRDFFPFMLDGAKDLNEVVQNASSTYSLIFGNEASGLSQEFQSVGQSVKIPQSDRIDSLNLSVAASIAMYAFSSHSKIHNE